MDDLQCIGIDEVGRGAWAGPLTVVAVKLDHVLPGLDDSKQVSAKRRTLLAQALRASGARLGVGWVLPAEIDRLGMTAAMELAVNRSLEKFDVENTRVIIDGHIDYVRSAYSEARVGADGQIPHVSAASIIAKVARDNLMKKMHLLYPGYAFDRNVGYGTALHAQGLRQHGPSPIHRQSFKPIKKYEHSHWKQRGSRRG